MSEEKHILSFWRYISFAAAALILVIVLFLSFYAVRDLAADVESIRSAPVPEGFDAALCYDDRLYACLLFGEEILPDDPLAEQRIEALISTSLHHFCERIFAAGLMYTMVISCTLAYYIYTVSNNEIAKHAAYIVLSAFAVYALYIGSVGIMFTSFGAAVLFPGCIRSAHSCSRSSLSGRRRLRRRYAPEEDTLQKDRSCSPDTCGIHTAAV